MLKWLFSFDSFNPPTHIKGCIRHERPLLAAEVLTTVVLMAIIYFNGLWLIPGEALDLRIMRLRVVGPDAGAGLPVD